jgi:hypothetical protein
VHEHDCRDRLPGREVEVEKSVGVVGVADDRVGQGVGPFQRGHGAQSAQAAGGDSSSAGSPSAACLPTVCPRVTPMTKWEYVTVPVLVHATKQILDNWGEDGWELVQMVPGTNPENLVAYMKRPKA